MSVEQPPDLLNEIMDINLAYLLLAQRLLREDYHAARLRLQIDESAAQLLQSLSSSQMVRLSRSNQVLFRFPALDDIADLERLGGTHQDASLAQLHMAIVNTSRSAGEHESGGERLQDAEKKSLIVEMRQVQLAIELIELGARLQILESETALSRGRLIRLYKEIRGMSPPKGMLPFSTGWFITWLPNIHSSLFYNYYRNLGSCERMEAFTKAYRLYLERTLLVGSEAVLGLTRAWTLIRYFESHMFELARCQRCNGDYVVHAHTPCRDFVCGICRPPSRAGKTRRRKQQLGRIGAQMADDVPRRSRA